MAERPTNGCSCIVGHSGGNGESLGVSVRSINTHCSETEMVLQINEQKDVFMRNLVQSIIVTHCDMYILGGILKSAHFLENCT